MGVVFNILHPSLKENMLNVTDKIDMESVDCDYVMCHGSGRLRNEVEIV